MRSFHSAAFAVLLCVGFAAAPGCQSQPDALQQAAQAHTAFTAVETEWNALTAQGKLSPATHVKLDPYVRAARSALAVLDTSAQSDDPAFGKYLAAFQAAIAQIRSAETAPTP